MDFFNMTFNRKLLTFFFLLISIHSGFSQILKPVKWSFSSEQKDKEATLILKATIDKGWHLYSQHIPDGGPIKTSFTFQPSKDYEMIGKTTEPKAEEFFDPNFEMMLAQFEHGVDFKQKIKIKSEKNFTIKGELEFMVCDNTRCLAPEIVEFSFNIKGSEAKPTGELKIDSAVFKDQTSNINPADTARPDETIPTASVVLKPDISTTLEPECGSTTGESHTSLWGIFIGGIIGGLIALLTPCVFPMIPLTVSFFTKRGASKAKGVYLATMYAVFIIVIYVTLGLLITIALGPDALNDMASNAFFNMLFFVVFLIFAISFFGAFEITLPSWMINKADAASERGGVIGIFFMAFTLSLVSFSCTGPIIGTLLVEAAHGRSYLGPLVGMTGFALALAIPFAVFALFPSWLHAMPKSGGWLNSVKVCLGFIELALALKFLSNVDLAYHWGILKREVFIALWVIIFGMMGFYLLGKIKFAHDDDVKHISIGRLLFTLITFTFTLYLIPGVWGAPLKIISGFPPPEFYKEWITQSGECPHDLNCFHDYDEAMKHAKAQKKPVMIDFTGWSCVNCRKMEDNVWSNPKVLKRLSEKYVLVSLYVDDKTRLPDENQYVSQTTGKKIKTTGNKWSDFQTAYFNTNSQPYYVLLDNSGKLLAHPRGYTPEVDEYVKFLDEGLCRYEKR